LKKRDEIIELVLKTQGVSALQDESPNDEEPSDWDIVMEALESTLSGISPETEIKTCEDFRYLKVDCCETCHTCYTHYEMQVFDIPRGGKAWIRCAIQSTVPGYIHKAGRRPAEGGFAFLGPKACREVARTRSRA
jgi:hypothetical protein